MGDNFKGQHSFLDPRLNGLPFPPQVQLPPAMPPVSQVQSVPQDQLSEFQRAIENVRKKFNVGPKQ